MKSFTQFLLEAKDSYNISKLSRDGINGEYGLGEGSELYKRYKLTAQWLENMFAFAKHYGYYNALMSDIKNHPQNSWELKDRYKDYESDNDPAERDIISAGAFLCRLYDDIVEQYDNINDPNLKKLLGNFIDVQPSSKAKSGDLNAEVVEWDIHAFKDQDWYYKEIAKVKKQYNTANKNLTDYLDKARNLGIEKEVLNEINGLIGFYHVLGVTHHDATPEYKWLNDNLSKARAEYKTVNDTQLKLLSFKLARKPKKRHA